MNIPGESTHSQRIRKVVEPGIPTRQPVRLETRVVSRHRTPDLQSSKPNHNFSTEILTETIRSKLLEFYGERRPRKFFECGSHGGILCCKNCDAVRELETHCSRKWCPRCQHRIVEKRIEILREWTNEIPQAKMVTVTSRNTDTITRKKLRQMNKNLWRLRRQQVFEHVDGGCQSIEVTNESRGWHIHAHLYVNARWVDKQKLSIAWGKLVGQDYAIVDVRDARDVDYAKEVAKYVCKPASMARWQPNEIAEFIHAVSGVRLFNVFGSLSGLRRKIAAQIATKRQPNVCDCGCEAWKYSPTFYATP